MSWLKIDDQIAFHQKTIAAGNAAFGAWVRMLAWSSAQLTNGRIPAPVAATMAKAAELKKLVEANMLDRVGADYEIHNYLKWNPSDADVIAKREEVSRKRQEAGKKGGTESGKSRREKQTAVPTEAKGEASCFDVASSELGSVPSKNEPPSHAHIDFPPMVPPAGGIIETGPSVPDDAEPAKPKRKASRCPDESAAPDAIAAWATSWKLDTKHPQFRPFLDYHQAKGSLFSSWSAAFRTWTNKPWNQVAPSNFGGASPADDLAIAESRRRHVPPPPMRTASPTVNAAAPDGQQALLGVQGERQVVPEPKTRPSTPSGPAINIHKNATTETAS